MNKNDDKKPAPQFKSSNQKKLKKPLSYSAALIEIDHSIEAALPDAVAAYQDRNSNYETELRPKDIDMLALFNDMETLHHMHIINYLKIKVEEKFLFPIRLLNANKPDAKHIGDDDITDGHGISHVSDEFEYNNTKFILPEYVQDYGFRGPVVDAYVQREAKAVVQKHFNEACEHVACHSVWHKCQYYDNVCAHEEHHSDRLWEQQMLDKRVQIHNADLENQSLHPVSWEDHKEKKKEEDEEERRKKEDMTKSSKEHEENFKKSEASRLFKANEMTEGHRQRPKDKRDSREKLIDALVLCHKYGIDGANWRNPEHDYWTPLMIAAYNNNDDAVEILLDKEATYYIAKWDSTNCFGESTFHLIAHSPHSQGCNKSRSIARALAHAAEIFASDKKISMKNLKYRIQSRLTYPHKKSQPNVDHAAYKYGRQYTDWKARHPGKVDTDYVHVKEDEGNKCCGFHAPFCAKLFKFLDYPVAKFYEFFERSWVNGGFTVDQYAEYHRSDIIKSIEHEIKHHTHVD